MVSKGVFNVRGKGLEHDPWTIDDVRIRKHCMFSLDCADLLDASHSWCSGRFPEIQSLKGGLEVALGNSTTEISRVTRYQDFEIYEPYILVCMDSNNSNSRNLKHFEFRLIWDVASSAFPKNTAGLRIGSW